MNMNALIAVLLLALASSSVLAAPPEKGGGEEVPYQLFLEMPWSEGNLGSVTSHWTDIDEAVPAGKRLVIRNVNYRFLVPVGQTASCRMNREGMTDVFGIPTPATWYSNGFGYRIGYANMLTEYYLDEGDFSVHCDRTDSIGTGTARVVITGGLVDAP